MTASDTTPIQLLILQDKLEDLKEICNAYEIEENDTIWETIASVEEALEYNSETLNEWNSRISQAKREYELIEDWLIETDEKYCVYCGRQATQRDHLLPLPWTGQAARILVPTVPSCGRCNNTLGDFPIPIIYERCQLIADSIMNVEYDTLRAGGAYVII